MIKPFEIIPPYRCRKCNTDNIELYDYYGNKISYKQVVDVYNVTKTLPETFLKKNIYGMRCRKCNTEYDIEWRDNGTFPRPLVTNKSIKIFKQLFINERGNDK